MPRFSFQFLRILRASLLHLLIFFMWGFNKLRQVFIFQLNSCLARDNNVELCGVFCRTIKNDWGNQVTVTVLTNFFYWRFKRLYCSLGWTIRRWMIRGSGNVFNSIHCAELVVLNSLLVKYFEIITCHLLQ